MHFKYENYSHKKLKKKDDSFQYFHYFVSNLLLHIDVSE